jgi:thymidylate synthase (FAD)
MKNKVLCNGHVEYVTHSGDDLLVCNAARVSFNKETEWGVDEEAANRLRKSGSFFKSDDVKKIKKSDEKLIKYLADNGHWTPFAHPQITLRIKAPIPIRTQLFKHKSGLIENETSRRYVSFEPDFYCPQWRGKPVRGAKQGSEDFIALSTKNINQYQHAIDVCLQTYKDLIDSGVAPEQARFVLPQAMYTEWFWTGSLAAFSRVYKLRCDSHAQWEIQQYANAISDIIKPLFPVSWKELTKPT